MTGQNHHPDRGAPLSDTSALPNGWDAALPGHKELLTSANGFAVADGALRVFGAGGTAYGLDALVWNRAEWRRAYNVPPSTMFWGANIFGDQYGFDAAAGRVTVLRCEGGYVDVLDCDSIPKFVREMAAHPDGWIETTLIAEASRAGFHPGPTEHLSFGLPLVCGGVASSENMEIAEAGTHLAILGHIISQLASVPEGTRISKFRDASD